MISLSEFVDPYDRKARLFPALICLLPLIIGCAISFPRVFSTIAGFMVLAATVGLLQLLSHLARDRGKVLESELFKAWGGVPSVTVFRYRDNRVPLPAKLKYHATLSVKSKIKGPTEEMEKSDPKMADDIYLSWSDYLRGKTRDTEKYHLLFKENINYGFRRNLLGIRWFCVLSGFLGFLAILVPALLSDNFSEITISFLLLMASYMGIFLFIVNDSWVKLVADAYSRQLIEAVNV